LTKAAPEQKSLLRDYAETILICVIFVIFSRAFVFQQSKIPSGSMMDTLLVGDYIMVNRFVYSARSTGLEEALLPVRNIRRGDVIVFKQPDKPEVDYIKRVAGLPDDMVELRGGYLWVNGKRVEEPHVEHDYRFDWVARRAGLRPNFENFGPMKVKPGHYFVLGDHRNASYDSREWGQVPGQLIKGRALLIWWSFNESSQLSATPGVGERVKSWAAKVAFFFTRTRWRRCFQIIR